MGLTAAKFEMGVTASATKAADMRNVVDAVNKTWETAFTVGTGDGQVDLFYADSRSVVSAATDIIDLNGVLLDSFGAAVDFLKIKGIVIVVKSGGTLSVGPAAALGWATMFNAAADRIKVSKFFANFSDAGWAVTAATADLLHLVNSAGATTEYDIFIFGSSA